MIPTRIIRKRIAAAFNVLLRRSRQGGGCRLGPRGGELEPEITVVGRADGDHFQRQVVERF